MKDQRILKVSDGVKGMPVYGQRGRKRLGRVSDAIFHPIKGRLLGLIVQTLRSEAWELSTAHFVITADEVLADEATLSEGREIVGARACKELTGSDVVTEDGKLLGRIIEVYLALDTHAAIYEVGRTGIRGILKRTFFISGDVPSFYSCHGLRMIVPADTEKNRSSSVIADAM
jgi:uncharacterized protein YrrD